MSNFEDQLSRADLRSQLSQPLQASYRPTIPETAEEAIEKIERRLHQLEEEQTKLLLAKESLDKNSDMYNAMRVAMKV